MIKDGSRNVKDPNGTSLNGVKQDTVLGAVDLKQNCKCDTLITGGTEWAHGGTLGNDRKSHENGYKLDFQINDQLSNYIQNNFTSIGNRGDGAPGYQNNSTSDGYWNESYIINGVNRGHWDVLFNQNYKFVNQ